MGDEDQSTQQGSMEDLGPMVNGVVWMMAIVAGAVIALRFWCKLSRGRGLWVDDYWLLASWACLVLLACFNSASVAFDFGKHGWRINWAEGDWLLLNMNLAGTFSIIACAWSKTSFAFTLLRIADKRWTRHVIWIIIITLNVTLGVAVLITWVQCWPVEKTWRTSIDGTCWPKKIQIKYNLFVTSYSGVTDVVLTLMPWSIIWSANMSSREKLGVMIAMSMGIFAGIISFLKLPSISGIGKTDIIETVPLVIWGGAESAVTILAASIPVLRLLIPRPNRHVNELDYRSAGSSARPTKLVDMDSSPGSVGLSSQKSMQTTTSAFEAGPQHSNFTPYRGDHLTSIAAALKSPLERSPGGMSQTMADMDSYDKDLPSLPNRTLPRSFGT